MDRKSAGALKRAAESRYWSEADGAAVVAALASSGWPLVRFAREHGIGAQRIRWWRARLSGRQAVPRARFAEVLLETTGAAQVVAAPVAAPANIEVILPSGVRVFAGQEASASAVAALVRELRDAGC